MLFTPPSLALTAPDEWKIHEPITAKCGRADAILLLQCVHFQKATFGKNRISSLVVFIVYPFDIREPCLHCETEFVAPGSTRKSLKPAWLGRRQAALHDTICEWHFVPLYG